MLHTVRNYKVENHIFQPFGSISLILKKQIHAQALDFHSQMTECLHLKGMWQILLNLKAVNAQLWETFSQGGK